MNDSDVQVNPDERSTLDASEPATIADASVLPQERTMDPVVQTSGLTKQYGDFVALQDCGVQVFSGEIFGLLGPNGAGKTTLIRSLLGYLKPSGGRATVVGFDPQSEAVEVRKRVAYLPGDARLPRHHRGETLLRFFSELHPHGNLSRSCEVADRLELDLRVRVGMMSTGMRQKLALAVVFGPDTPLLILDEPTANLDPTVRANVLELVLEAHAHGRTVIFSSHVLSEIEDTCHRVAFLRRGKLVHELAMQDLFQKHRVHGTLPAETGLQELQIPDSFRDRVTLKNDETETASAVIRGRDQSIRLDTFGDLAPILPWLNSIGLSRVRIEPLGLRSVYDQVHREGSFREGGEPDASAAGGATP